MKINFTTTRKQLLTFFFATMMGSTISLQAQDYIVVAKTGLDCNASGDTYDDDSFYLENRSTDPSYIIKEFYFDVTTTAMPDLLFDPYGLAGDKEEKALTPNTIDALLTGMKGISYNNNVENGFERAGAYFNYTDGTKQFFDPGESFKFGIDIDPTSLKDILDPGNFGVLSGGELAGITLVVEFADGTIIQGQLFPDIDCPGQSKAVLRSGITPPATPTISLAGYPTVPARVYTNPHQVVVDGTPGDSVVVYVSEGEMGLHGVHYDNGPCKCFRPFEVEEYEANNFLTQQAFKAKIGPSGTVTVPVNLTNFSSDIFDGLNHFYARSFGAATGDILDGKPLHTNSLISNVQVLEFFDGYPENLNINVGDTVNYTDTNGELFLSDRYYYDNTNTHIFYNPYVPTIANTADVDLFIRARAGYIEYDIPIENGKYEVTFYFAELHHGTPYNAPANHAGARDFNIYMEDSLYFERYDIIAAAGSTATATTITFTVEVHDRELYLKMTDDPVNPTGGPLLNGLSLRPFIPTSLPVEISSFRAKAVENTVKLDWITANEKNNDYFTVEKSTDGFLFTPVTDVDGVGNSNTAQTYSAVDFHPFTGLSYYRLKQTDIDGGVVYSSTIAVKFSAGPSMRIFPNPIEDGSAALQLSGFNPDRKLALKVKDMYYRDVWMHNLESTDILGGVYRLQLSDVPAGIYFLHLSDGINTQSSKIIIR